MRRWLPSCPTLPHLVSHVPAPRVRHSSTPLECGTRTARVWNTRCWKVGHAGTSGQATRHNRLCLSAVVKVVQEVGVRWRVPAVGFLESRTPTSSVVSLTSTQLSPPELLRLLLNQPESREAIAMATSSPP